MPETPPSQALQIKETLISIVISFVMAFVFRGFVIEGFQIPTGSMAPTLLGKHVHIRNPDTGSEWEVGPWNYAGNRPGGVPMREQVGLELNDPITGAEVIRASEPLRAGDRIFVLKYLRHVHEPRRWDVVVFKNPSTEENYIKRLVGLPNEQMALVDGDVFTRPYEKGVTTESGVETWNAKDWTIARKPERVQRAMFQTVFDSRLTPANPGPEYRSSWVPGQAGAWEGLREPDSYRFTGTGETTLAWDSGLHPIDDWYPYNQTDVRLKPNARSYSSIGPYPVSDIAMSLGYEPRGGASSAAVTGTLKARGREFQVVVTAGKVAVQMRREGEDAWTTLDEGTIPAFREGKVTNIEFWHVDQALWAFVDGKLVAGGAEKGAYALSPGERIEASTGTTLEQIYALPRQGDPLITTSRLGVPPMYRKPEVSWSFAGGPFTLRRVVLKRDIYYQVSAALNQPTRGGDPLNYPSLGPDEFFVCGDNSPASKDARLWTREDGAPDPWIADQIDPSVGKVSRKLMIGHAFVVYFPAPVRAGKIPVPDAGKVRWIW
ncbi:MAG: S26 family signal peptidase [Phycisphaerales bacterium]